MHLTQKLGARVQAGKGKSVWLRRSSARTRSEWMFSHSAFVRGQLTPRENCNCFWNTWGGVTAEQRISAHLPDLKNCVRAGGYTLLMAVRYLFFNGIPQSLQAVIAFSCFSEVSLLHLNGKKNTRYAYHCYQVVLVKSLDVENISISI